MSIKVFLKSLTSDLGSDCPLFLTTIIENDPKRVSSKTLINILDQLQTTGPSINFCKCIRGFKCAKGKVLEAIDKHLMIKIAETEVIEDLEIEGEVVETKDDVDKDKSKEIEDDDDDEGDDDDKEGEEVEKEDLIQKQIDELKESIDQINKSKADMINKLKGLSEQVSHFGNVLEMFQRVELEPTKDTKPEPPKDDKIKDKDNPDKINMMFGIRNKK